MQWNCRSLRNKKQDILFLANKYKPIIFAIQESWLRPGSHFRVCGYSCLRDDRDDGRAGAAILVSRSVIYSSIPIPPHSNNFNIVAVSISNISFLSIYLPDPNSTVLSELYSIISTIPSPMVVLGDFNIHHTSWGSYYCDPLSTSFLNLVDDFNLVILNDGSPTRRATPTQVARSAMDLSLCSSSLSSEFTWNILSSSFGSDHFPITLEWPQCSIPYIIKNASHLNTN